MYTVFIFAVIGGLLAIVTRIWRPMAVVTPWQAVIFFAAVFVGLGTFVAHVLSDRLALKAVESSRHFVAVRSIEGATGNFVLGTGAIGGYMFYRVYVKNDDGSLSPREIPVNRKTRIFESPDLHNEVVWRQTWKVRSLVAGSRLDGWAFDNVPRIYNLESILTVPVGAVVQNLNAN
jgi:hypothetical protein